jgi:hypothetical protein
LVHHRTDRCVDRHRHRGRSSSPPQVLGLRRPSDPDGTPMTFIGQFAAGEISNLMPPFTYWLYWSPWNKKFAQIDDHD